MPPARLALPFPASETILTVVVPMDYCSTLTSQRFQSEVSETMNDRLSESKDYSPTDSRANLFYFLQRMSNMAQEGRDCGVQSPISVEQMKSGQDQNSIVL
jgi:hypothetical protein